MQYAATIMWFAVQSEVNIESFLFLIGKTKSGGRWSWFKAKV